MKLFRNTGMLGLLFGLLACGSEINTTPTATGVVTAQIDGQAFASEQASSTYDKVSKELTLTGFNSVHATGFTLKNFTGPATVSLGDALTKGSTGSYTDAKTNTTYAIKEGRSGSVTVTRYEGKMIEGTFSMKTYNTPLKREITVSNGTFRVPVAEL